MKELQAALAAAVAGEVRFDAGARAAYASEASNYRQVPIGVILPRSAEDVMAALAVCRAHGAPVLARGGGTSMCGQSVNVAVVIDCSKYMDRVLSIDAATKSARVEPGVVCDSLSAAAAGHGLVFGPDPATHSRCTLGGMIGNNSCGAHSVMAGKTVENIEALEVATYDGARFWCGPTDEAAFDRILSKNDRQAEIYRGLKLLADRYAERIRAGFPTITNSGWSVACTCSMWPSRRATVATSIDVSPPPTTTTRLPTYCRRPSLNARRKAVAATQFGASEPGTGSGRPLCAPMPMNTASKSFCSCSIVTSRPMRQLSLAVTPRSRMRWISASSTSRGVRNPGMP